MKPAIITLIFIIVISVIILPLTLITLGKLKNPVDKFATQAAPGSIQQNSISPNYIPESGQPGTPNAQSEELKKTKERFKACFSEDKVELEFAGGLSIEKKEGEKTVYINNETGTQINVTDFVFVERTSSSLKKYDNNMIMATEKVDQSCVPNTAELPALYSAYNDAGDFLVTVYNPGPYQPAGFDLTERGTATLNGLKYHWYLFEDRARLGKRPEEKTLYQVVITTYFNGRIQTSIAQGSSLVFKTPRGFLKQIQVFLGGTVYGQGSLLQGAQR